MSRTGCATCGETGIDHAGFACRDCDGQGSTPPTQPPAPTGASARDVIRRIVSDAPFHRMTNREVDEGTDAILAALAEAGYVIVERDNLEMAVEWMDQTENPWSGSETFAETWTAALVAQYELKDVIHEFYAARQPEGVRDGE